MLRRNPDNPARPSPFAARPLYTALMGIVINYKGTLNDMAQLDNLVADARLFCQKAGWEFDEVCDRIMGIEIGAGMAFRDEEQEETRTATPEDGIQRDLT